MKSRNQSKKQRKSKGSSSSIMELPESITLDILSRLPIKTILRCKSVCKTWYNSLLDPYFSQLHFSRAQVQFLLQGGKKNNRLVLAELDEDSCISNTDDDFRVPKKSLMNLNLEKIFPNPSEKIEIFDSCNAKGFILMKEVDNLSPETWKPYHVYNPITGQHIVAHQTNKHPLRPSGCWLGFSHKTNQLKLVRFLWHEENKKLEADIQTIGTNSWRNIGETPCNLDISANGVYHWVNQEKFLTYSFNFEDEAFKSFYIPEYADSYPIVLIVDDEFIEPVRYMKNGEFVILCRSRNTVVCYIEDTRNFRYIKFDGRFKHNYVFPYVPSFIRVPSGTR